MKIIEFSPFFNEHKIADMKIKETAYWVDELYICEADKNFSYEDKSYDFNPALPSSRVKYLPIKTAALFRPPLQVSSYYNPDTCGAANFDGWYWQLLGQNAGYHNEAMQRNACAALKEQISDEDIIILSDLDEILDSRLAERIVHEVKKHQIITVKLHYSVFYLNLFTNKNHGTPDFSYRTFVMTGKYFRTMPFTADYLRKKGIAGALTEAIYCVEDFMGFHHSWLQHATNAFSKLKAFEANVQDKRLISEDFATTCIRNMKLPYINAELFVDNEKPFLRGVRETDTAGLWYQS